MDDDTNSTASFEDVVERFRDMSRIGAFAETNADAPPQVDTLDEDVPDICYVLQRDTYRDGLVEGEFRCMIPYSSSHAFPRSLAIVLAAQRRPSRTKLYFLPIRLAIVDLTFS